MEIGLRFLAFILDIAFCVSAIPVFSAVSSKFMEIANSAGSAGILAIPFMFVLLIAWPFFYFGVPTGIWGRTPGKWICRVKVVDAYGNPPGLWRGLGRETLKLLAVGCQIGAIFCAYQLVYHGFTWYDQLCGTRVEFTPWVRLNATQKNFRKKYKPNRF